MTIINRTKNFHIFFILVSCLISNSVLSQETANKILIIDFKLTEGSPEYISLEKKIPAQLKSLLNMSIQASFDVEILETVRREQNLKDSLDGFLNDDQLKLFGDSATYKFDYLVCGRVYENRGIINCDVQLIDTNLGGVVLSFKEKEGATENFVEKIAEKLAAQIEAFLVRKIKIGLVKFDMTGGDSTSYGFLAESIPTMLATGLTSSREFSLIELKSEKLIDDMIEKKKMDSYNQTSLIKYMKDEGANYLIMGEYWELNDQIRIDARCVSIDTREIILSEGINIDQIESENISAIINELASKISVLIKKDFIRKDKPNKSIAVAALPPTPESKNNLIISDHMRKTLTRKLRLANNVYVKDFSSELYQDLIQKDQKFKICSRLGVEYLLSLQFEQFEDEPYIFEVDLFYIENPTLEVYKEIRSIEKPEIDSFLNLVAKNTLNRLDVDTTGELINSISAIKVPTYLERWTLGFRGAFVSRAESRLYFNDGLGSYWELFMNFHFTDRWRMELHLGKDFGKEIKLEDGTEAWINSLQAGVLAKYEVLMIDAIRIYGGAGATFFSTFRGHSTPIGNTEEAGQRGIGLLLTAGIEVKIEEIYTSIFLEPRYTLATSLDQTSLPSGFEFPGGQLGGQYWVVGIGYNFNW